MSLNENNISEIQLDKKYLPILIARRCKIWFNADFRCTTKTNG